MILRSLSKDSFKANLNNFFHVNDAGLSEHARLKLERDFIKADKTALLILVVYWLVLATLGGGRHGYFLLGYIGGGLALGFGVLGYAFFRGTYINRILVGVTGCLVEVIYIQQELGTPTSHLVYFMSLGVLLVYRDGFAAVSSLAMVMTHHLTATFCEAASIEIMGMPILAFNWGRWGAYVTHLYWAILMAVLLCFVTYNSMKEFLTNETLLEDMENINKELEDLVAERSASLMQTTTDIKSIFANLSEGIFTITQENKVDPEYSSALERILETQEISGQKAVNLLFKDSNLELDVIQGVDLAIEYCLGKSKTEFNEHQHYFVNECRKTSLSHRKNLEFTWTPITNKSRTLNNEYRVNKILVRVADVTELKALQTKENRKQKDLSIFFQLLLVKPADFFTFVELSEKMLAENKHLIEQSQENYLLYLCDNFRAMGFKSVELGFSYLKDLTYEFVDEYEALVPHPEKKIEQKELIRKIERINELLHDYLRVSQERLGWNQHLQDNRQHIPMSLNNIEEIMSLIETMDNDDINQMQMILSHIHTVFASSLKTSLIGTDE